MAKDAKGKARADVRRAQAEFDRAQDQRDKASSSRRKSFERAQAAGLTVREFPVEWRADPDSRYKPFSGSFRNLFELVRIQLQ